MYEEFRKVINDTFSNLTDPDQIAELCRKEQIQGFLNNESSNPMVKLIRGKVDFNVCYEFGKKEGLWWCYNDEYAMKVETFKICDQFVDRFHCKAYTDLIAFYEKDKEMWKKKLDAHLRKMLDEGFSGCIDISLRVKECDIEQIKQVGLNVHCQVNEIITGNIAITNLQKIAELDCVLEINLSELLSQG